MYIVQFVTVYDSQQCTVCDYQLRLILVGESTVGKTSLIRFGTFSSSPFFGGNLNQANIPLTFTIILLNHPNNPVIYPFQVGNME